MRREIGSASSPTEWPCPEDMPAGSSPATLTARHCNPPSIPSAASSTSWTKTAPAIPPSDGSTHLVRPPPSRRLFPEASHQASASGFWAPWRASRSSRWRIYKLTRCRYSLHPLAVEDCLHADSIRGKESPPFEKDSYNLCSLGRLLPGAPLHPSAVDGRPSTTRSGTERQRVCVGAGPRARFQVDRDGGPNTRSEDCCRSRHHHGADGGCARGYPEGPSSLASGVLARFCRRTSYRSSSSKTAPSSA
jgi:hypothetical protein